MGLKEIGWEGVARINLAKDRDKWWILVIGLLAFRLC